LRDDDHLMRHYPLGFIFSESTIPSLGIQALRLTLNKDLEKKSEKSLVINDIEIEVDHRGFTRLNYYPFDEYKVISFIDVYNGTIAADYFKGKKVIVGISEAGVEDIVSTPIGAIPGPYLHYTFLSNYLQGHLLRHYDVTLYILIALFLFFPLLLTIFVKKIGWRVAINISVLTIFMLVSKLLYIYAHIWLETFYAFTTLIMSAILSEIIAFRTQEREARFIQSAFSSYLSPILLKKLKKSPELLTLGGEMKELTVFFSDIRSFTSISESMTPEKLVVLLNRYFTPMAHIVRKHDGMLDKYIGDAIMAFYNAPIDVVKHPDKACETALEMIAHLNTLNIELESEGIPGIKIGIGLNTAEVTVGNMGSDDRFNYTVIGDGVNLASRVEGLTKNYHVDILITEFTHDKLTDDFLCRRLEAVKVKGKNKAVLLYELMFSTPENKKLKDDFEKILELFESQDFESSAKGFKSLYGTTGDLVSKLFYEKSLENAQRIANHEAVEAVKFTTK
ncbi:MAG: adenylate/guanylate cyclase domain-containing protein, partial [Thiovulaceae bacterium]|nr:adenylate/guanylate cyclase domain-containing protein [Sulfurimonadaceae bacterium]